MNKAISIGDSETIDDVAVKVNNISKSYAIWASPKARLAHPLLNIASQFVPFSKLGINNVQAKKESMYREFHALHDISFEIKKGESWGFIGVNGSGKSTLLKIIAGNLRPSSGSVEVDGKVAILDYGSGISGEFTGRENVYTKAAILGLTRKQIDERFKSITDFADIGEFIDQPVKTYSSGMVARLGFAIMIHVDADILITDEALAVGDAFFVQKSMSRIRSFLKNGTFLFVSHSVNDVVALCQKVVWLENGSIKMMGDAKQVTEAYTESSILKDIKYNKRNKKPSIPENLKHESDDKIVKHDDEYVVEQPKISELINSRPPKVFKDPRTEFINRSDYRNDIKIPSFDIGESNYGSGRAKIVDVTFEDESGSPLAWIIGGEIISLTIAVTAYESLNKPIIGFQVKDRTGQVLFADNSYLISLEKPFSVKKDETFRGHFVFQIPLLPIGHYSLRAAVADGEESEAEMLDIIDNALIFESQTSAARHGLVGVSMMSIAIDIQ